MFCRTEFPRAIPNISVVLRTGTSGVVVTIIAGVLFIECTMFSVQSYVPFDLQINKYKWKSHCWLDSFVKEMRCDSYMRVRYWTQGLMDLRCYVTGAMQRRLS